LRASSRPDEEPDEAGALILDRDFGIAASTEAAWRWIDRLGLKQPSEEEPLPAFMYPALRPSAGRACRKLEATFDSYRDIEVTLTTQGQSSDEIQRETRTRGEDRDGGPRFVQRHAKSPSDHVVFDRQQRVPQLYGIAPVADTALG
jgi:hypothetical protein